VAGRALWDEPPFGERSQLPAIVATSDEWQLQGAFATTTPLITSIVGPAREDVIA
jgi:hypothetical protein